MSAKIGELFGVEYKDGLPIDNYGGGGAPPKSESHNPSVFNAHLFSIVASEDSLKEEYNFSVSKRPLYLYILPIYLIIKR